MSTPKRILIVRLSALGDVVQTLPVLARLREAFPSAHIGWLVEAQAAVLLKDHPMLDAVHISDRKRWMKALLKPQNWAQTVAEIQSFLREIESQQYDVALDFQGLLKSALTTVLTKIPRRVGFVAAREGASHFYTHKVPLRTSFFDPLVPIGAHFDAMVEALGVPIDTPAYCRLAPVPLAEKDALLEKLSAFTAFEPLVVLAPATQWHSKHWSLAHWQALVQSLLSQTRANVVLIGGPGDQALCMDVLDALPVAMTQGRVINLAGQTSVNQLISLFEVSRVVIGSDSAPLHLAGAVGVPHVVGLYGPTSPRRTPPPGHGPVTLLTTPQSLDCLYCDHAQCPLPQQVCMQQISVSQVLAVVLSCL